MNCKYCRANCTGAKQDREIALCLGYDPPKTNADRLRAMSDEELAGWLAINDSCPSTEQERKCNNRCGECWLDWLRQEVRNNG